MRKFTFHAALIGALLVVFGAGSFALAGGGKSHITSDDMTGYLEAPPASSVASGSFDAWIDDATDEINYTFTYERLEAPVVPGAHPLRPALGVGGHLGLALRGHDRVALGQHAGLPGSGRDGQRHDHAARGDRAGRTGDRSG
jgi:hypothetical protein